MRPKDDEWLEPTIALDSVDNAFNGCIGAIDGTHIRAFVPKRLKDPYFNRKGYTSQNVFAAIRHDLSFSYVLAGAPGSLNDATLIKWALERGFRIPRGRFYLADAGFGSQQGILLPYPGQRYHLDDWRLSGQTPDTPAELYNIRHARLRVPVEHVFGRLKGMWKIVRSSAPEYSLEKQRAIVYCVCGLHNFIIQEEGYQQEPLTPQEEEKLQEAAVRANTELACRDPEEIRQAAAETMWNNYRAYWRSRLSGR